jgi:hypothetical protein
MKAHRRITRAIRALAMTGCFAAIGLPASAGARPIDYHPVSQEVKAIAAAHAYHPHGRPGAFAGDQSYTLPAGFRSDSTSSGYHPTASTSTSTQPPSVVVREITTNTGDHTLAIVLASVALGIALGGSAYAVIRTTRLQRRLPQSS